MRGVGVRSWAAESVAEIVRPWPCNTAAAAATYYTHTFPIQGEEKRRRATGQPHYVCNKTRHKTAM